MNNLEILAAFLTPIAIGIWIYIEYKKYKGRE